MVPTFVRQACSDLLRIHSLVPYSVEHPLMMHRQHALLLAALQLIVLLAMPVSHSLPAVHPKQICQLSPSIVGQHLRKHPCLVLHPVQVESTLIVRMISYVTPTLHVPSAIPKPRLHLPLSLPLYRQTLITVAGRLTKHQKSVNIPAQLAAVESAPRAYIFAVPVLCLLYAIEHGNGLGSAGPNRDHVPLHPAK